MAFTYKDIQDEISRRSVRDQGGAQFTTAIKNIANTSLFRLSREAHWRSLRRTAKFDTETQITSGTVSATKDSKSMTGTSISLITNGVEIGRRLDVQGSSISFTFDTITGEDAWTVNRAYDGTTASSLTFTIYGKEEYTLPIQVGRVAFLWHEAYGYPYILNPVTAFEFFSSGSSVNTSGTPISYRMWGEDDIIEQPLEASVVRISSSVSGDTSKAITVFGTVSSYPDFEVITTNSSNGTTAVDGAKSFTNIDRIVKDASTTGRITCTTNSTNVTVATLPVGDSTNRLMYKKIQIWPLPDAVFPINCWYYKEPWRMVANGDVHELGHDFDEAIILLSVSKIKAENSQKEAEAWFALYKDELRSLRRVNADKLDDFLELRSPRDSKPSASRLHPNLLFQQLGANYGPMSRY